jgi:hypothetical protein
VCTILLFAHSLTEPMLRTLIDRFGVGCLMSFDLGVCCSHHCPLKSDQMNQETKITQLVFRITKVLIMFRSFCKNYLYEIKSATSLRTVTNNVKVK